MVGEDVGGGDRLAEVAGAEEGDVVLARGPEDLADLGDERIDVVADPALAELAEAREVAADLGRVDVRPGGEVLRGDRLPAHLAGLDQDLQVAREPGRDAERKAIGAARRCGPTPAAGLIGGAPGAHAGKVSSRASTASGSKISSLTRTPFDLDDRDQLEHLADAAPRRPRCRPREARNGRRRGAAPRAPRGPRRRDDSPARAVQGDDVARRVDAQRGAASRSR